MHTARLKTICASISVDTTRCLSRGSSKEILGSESFARWLVSLALALELALVLQLALDIERCRITASVNDLTCPLPPHHQSVVALALELAIELALALDIERYRITASVNHLTCPLPPHQSVI